MCEIPFTQLESLSEKLPSLQRHFLQLMGKEITMDHHIITLLSKNTAEERIATVLLSLSHRHHRRHLSATSFNLPMSRADLGNYLGLTIETVSRVLGRFQKSKLITVNRKAITILNMDGLKQLGHLTLC